MGPDEEAPTVPPPPTFRGRLHQAAFFGSIPAALLLLLLARSARTLVAVAVYGASLVALFGTSAAYHRLRWRTGRTRSRIRRLDHSMIYLLIAGTYTPVALLVLRGAWTVVILALIWGGAVAGIAMKGVGLDRLQVPTAVLYIAMGWLLVVAAPQVVRALHPGELIPLVAGGLLYTAGAVVLALRRPDPNPLVFGYHEVFHLSTVVAASCHYASVLQVVLALR